MLFFFLNVLKLLVLLSVFGFDDTLSKKKRMYDDKTNGLKLHFLVPCDAFNPLAK